MVARRVAGEPLQYVLGQWGFRRLDLLVDRRVLIPRPETEVVAEVAIDEVRRLVPWDRRTPPLVADIGTGSGAIALAVADEVGRARVWATDVSADAVAVARANLAGAGSLVGPRVRLLAGSWLEPLPADAAGPPRRGGVEPALRGGRTRTCRRRWPTGSRWGRWCRGPPAWRASRRWWRAPPAGWPGPGAVVVEIAPHQADEASALAAGAGFDEVEVRSDLADRPRVLVGRYRG